MRRPKFTRDIQFKFQGDTHWVIQPDGSVVSEQDFNLPLIRSLADHAIPYDYHLKSLRGARTYVFAPLDRSVMACVWFCSTKGNPTALCSLDYHGRVVRITYGRAKKVPPPLPNVFIATPEPDPDFGIDFDSGPGLNTAMSGDQFYERVFQKVENQKLEVRCNTETKRYISLLRGTNGVLEFFTSSGFGSRGVRGKLSSSLELVDLHVAVSLCGTGLFLPGNP